MIHRALSRIGLLLFAGAQACSADFEPVGDAAGEAFGGTEQELGCGPSPTPPPVCGGIAGLQCPGQGTCVDDPSDECDPEAGNADCIGLCRCLLQIGAPLPTCQPSESFSGSPDVCGCAPTPLVSCAAVFCPAGAHCEVSRSTGLASCVSE